MCLLLDTFHWNDHCIIVCGKWIFDSNFEVTFSLTQDCLNYTCRGYDKDDTNEIKFVGVLQAIRAVPPKVVQIRVSPTGACPC